MQEMIEQIVQGKIEYERGTLDFSVGEVNLSIQPRTIAEGSFTVYAPEGELTEGFVRSSDSRMEILGQKFSGVQDEIIYRFHGEMAEPDQVVTGNFRIVSNHGEYVIPFVVSTKESTLTSTLGSIRNLFHFVNLAKTNWNEAVRLFYHPNFVSILTGNDSQYIPVYKGLAGQNSVDLLTTTSTQVTTCMSHNMEAFLVSVGKKKPVELLADVGEVLLEDPVEDARYQFEISRNGWGYARAYIQAEGDFLSVDERELTEDDFLGNVYTVYYYIQYDKLHEGKNYGKIQLLMDHEIKEIPVVVSVQRQRKQFKQLAFEKKRITKSLMEYYKNYKLKRISKKIWMTETEKLVQRLIASDEYDIAARLYKIQILITQERINEARWELDQIKVSLWDLKEQVPDLWCYYLYLISLYTEDETKEEEILREITSYHNAYPKNWQIAYLLSCLAPEYTRNPVRKWELFESLFDQGCNSPVIYLETITMLHNNPTLLHKITSFELHVLHYALANGVLKSELRILFVSLAAKEKNYYSLLLKVLKECYKENPQDDILQIICAQLIKDNRLNAEAHTWYALGVQQELRITRLFEYYMMSLDIETAKVLPKTVQLYFSYHSDLDYKLNAFLYAYVIRNREQDPAMYERFGAQMEEFVSKQLKLGHVNQNMAYLYTMLLTEDKLTEEDAENLAKLLFIKEVHVNDKDMKHVIVSYLHNKKEMSYPIVDGVALVPVYVNGARFLLEDAQGRRYLDWIPYEIKNLFTSNKLIMMAAPLVKNNIGFDYHVCYDDQDMVYITEENEPRFKRLLQSDFIQAEYKKEICMKLLDYYYDKDLMDQLDTFLENLQVRMIAASNWGQCLKYLIIRGFYEKSYEWLQLIGCNDLEPRYLVRLCTELLERRMTDGVVEEPEDALLQLMSQALQKGKYNDKMLTCMCTYFRGGIREMRDLWNACKGFGIETRAVEERILIDLIYTGGYVAEKKDIFRSYLKNYPNPVLLAATLTQSCYDYFVKEKLMESYVFEALPRIFESDEKIELDVVCSFAFLKYYAENKDLLQEKDAKYVEWFIHKMLSEGKRFGTFKEYVDYVPQLALYMDKTTVEYHAKPGNKVMIHYLIEQDELLNNDYCVEPMEMIYDGVYEKSFVLFFGDTVQYYITEEEDDKEQLTESGTISKSDIGAEHQGSRFELLNDVMIGKNLMDYDTVDKSLEEYFWKEYLVEKLFGDRK